MKNLLKFEFRKLRSQKIFFISLAVIFVTCLLSALSSKFLLAMFGTDAPSSFSTAEQVMYSATGLTFNLVCIIIVAVVVCRDYEWSIVKNVYARGYRRESFYLSKFVYTGALVTAIFLSSILFTALVYGALFSFEWVGGKGVLLLLIQYLSLMAGFSFYYAIASTTKRLGATIAISIFAPSIISLVLGALTFAFKIDNFSLASYWFSAFIDDLTEFETVHCCAEVL